MAVKHSLTNTITRPETAEKIKRTSPIKLTRLQVKPFQSALITNIALATGLTVGDSRRRSQPRLEPQALQAQLSVAVRRLQADQVRRLVVVPQALRQTSVQALMVLALRALRRLAAPRQARLVLRRKAFSLAARLAAAAAQVRAS